MTLRDTTLAVSRSSVNLPVIGTVSIGAIVIIFAIAYLLTRRKSKYAVVKL